MQNWRVELVEEIQTDARATENHTKWRHSWAFQIASLWACSTPTLFEEVDALLPVVAMHIAYGPHPYASHNNPSKIPWTLTYTI